MNRAMSSLKIVWCRRQWGKTSELYTHPSTCCRWCKQNHRNSGKGWGKDS